MSVVTSTISRFDRYFRTAVLNFSSGTTGMPKACMISHHNLVANSEQGRHLDDVARDRRQDPNYAWKDIHCAYLPFFHASKSHLPP